MLHYQNYYQANLPMYYFWQDFTKTSICELFALQEEATLMVQHGGEISTGIFEDRNKRAKLMLE